VRHRHTQQHEVGLILAGKIECLHTVARDFTLEIEVLQDRGHHNNRRRIVVGDDNPSGAVSNWRLSRNLRRLDESEDSVRPKQEFLGLPWAQNEIAVEVGNDRELRH